MGSLSHRQVHIRRPVLLGCMATGFTSRGASDAQDHPQQTSQKGCLDPRSQLDMHGRYTSQDAPELVCLDLLTHARVLQMEANGELGKPKPVHRIAFFSRLDERKGIKLFVEAVSLLPHHKRPNFEARPHSCALVNLLWLFSSFFCLSSFLFEVQPPGVGLPAPHFCSGGPPWACALVTGCPHIPFHWGWFCARSRLAGALYVFSVGRGGAGAWACCWPGGLLRCCCTTPAPKSRSWPCLQPPGMDP